jgi:hypothetical protein
LPLTLLDYLDTLLDSTEPPVYRIETSVYRIESALVTIEDLRMLAEDTGMLVEDAGMLVKLLVDSVKAQRNGVAKVEQRFQNLPVRRLTAHRSGPLPLARDWLLRESLSNDAFRGGSIGFVDEAVVRFGDFRTPRVDL